MCIVLFFTFFGDAIYKHITPAVTAYTVGWVNEIDGVYYFRVPKEAIRDNGTVLEIVTVTGYFRDIMFLNELNGISILDADFPDEEGFIYVKEGLLTGTQLLVSQDTAFSNGTRVIIE